MTNHFTPLFSLFSSCQFMFNRNLVHDWIRTGDLWCRKRPLGIPTEPQPLPQPMMWTFLHKKWHANCLFLPAGPVHDHPHHAGAGVFLRLVREQHPDDVILAHHREGPQDLSAWKVHPHHLCQQGNHIYFSPKSLSGGFYWVHQCSWTSPCKLSTTTRRYLCKV